MDSSEYLVSSHTPHQPHSAAQKSPKRKFEDLETDSSTLSIARVNQSNMSHLKNDNTEQNNQRLTTTKWVHVFQVLGMMAMCAYRAATWTRSFVSRHSVIEIRTIAHDGFESVKRRCVENVVQPTLRRTHRQASPPHMTTATISRQKGFVELFQEARRTGQNFDSLLEANNFYQTHPNETGFVNQPQVTAGNKSANLDIDNLRIPGAFVSNYELDMDVDDDIVATHEPNGPTITFAVPGYGPDDSTILDDVGTDAEGGDNDQVPAEGELFAINGDDQIVTAEERLAGPHSAYEPLTTHKSPYTQEEAYTLPEPFSASIEQLHNQDKAFTDQKPSATPHQSITAPIEPLYKKDISIKDQNPSAVQHQKLTASIEPLYIQNKAFTNQKPSDTPPQSTSVPYEPPTAPEPDFTKDELPIPPRHNYMPGDVFAFEEEAGDNREYECISHDDEAVVDSNNESKNVPYDFVQDLDHSELVETGPDLDENFWIPSDFPNSTYSDADFDINYHSHSADHLPAAVVSRNYRSGSRRPIASQIHGRAGHHPEELTTPPRGPAAIPPRKATPARHSRRSFPVSSVRRDHVGPLPIEDRAVAGPAQRSLWLQEEPVTPNPYFNGVSTPEAQRAVKQNRRSPKYKPVRNAHVLMDPQTQKPMATVRVFNMRDPVSVSEHLQTRMLSPKEQRDYQVCLDDIPRIMQNGDVHARSQPPGSQEDDITGTTAIATPNITITPARIHGAPQDTSYIVSDTIDTSIEMTDAPEDVWDTAATASSSNLTVSQAHGGGEPPQTPTKPLSARTASSLTSVQSPSAQIISEVESASAIPVPHSPELSPSARVALESKHGSKGSQTPARRCSNESLNEAVDFMSISRDKSKLRKEKAAAEAKAKRAREAAKRAAEAAAAAEAKRIAEEEAAALAASKARRMPSVPFIQPLPDAWERRLHQEMAKAGNAIIVKSVTGTELTRHDFASVMGQSTWLNDEIINAYLDLIVDYANTRDGVTSRTSTPKYLSHNSFFYSKLASAGPKGVNRWMKRKKAEGVKLLEVEQVFIPVNNASHWTIIIVSPIRRTIEYLDSYGGSSDKFVSNTKSWLAMELGSAWKPDEWTVLNTQSAVQTNGYDCGVFAITNAKCVAFGLDPTCYHRSDLATQRHRIAAELLAGGFVGDLAPPANL